MYDEFDEYEEQEEEFFEDDPLRGEIESDIYWY